ncbi:sodium:proton antiporter [Candidatus Gracilibacteria bacterium]|nr:sodium:proton antiporter [Candidatus Gracilibacteria bacterium]
MEAFIPQTLSFLTLLVISCFTYIFSKKINFPYTVLLVLVGLLLVQIAEIPLFSFIDDFELTPDILFLVFLPVLLFESAYNINYRHLIQNWKTIGSLAIFGFLISAFLIAGGLFFIFPLLGLQIPFLVCLLFGALISATDPVAVLSIFKSLGAPRRLTIIFEGESLFNDGTAVALFMVVLGIIKHGGDFTGLTLLEGFWEFLSMVIGGGLFGIFMGVLFSKMVGSIKNNEEVEIVLTMLLAHITFITSEIITELVPFISISGVISTVIASLVIGNYGRYKITPKVEAHMEKFWEFFAFVSNSIVFILLGLTLSRLEVSISKFTLPIIITILVVMLARVISVFLPVGIINKFKLEEKIPLSRTQLLAWGSLRGALAMMMVFMIPDGPKIEAFTSSVGWTSEYSIREFLMVLTISCIMFTLFIKATTTSLLMKKMGVSKLQQLEEFEYEEGKILSSLKILKKLQDSHKKAYLTEIEYDELKDKYTMKLNGAIENMKELLKGNKDKAEGIIKKAISLHALGIEKQYLKELFYYNEIDERNFKYIFRRILKQIERIESGKPQFKDKNDQTLDDYDIFTRVVMQVFQSQSTKLDSYIRNRTRVVITRKVIKELQELQSIDFGFHSDIFNETIELYAYLNKKADEKRLKIFLTHKATINAIESRLINKSLLKLEEKTIKDLYNKEIITPKLYIRFKDEIEEEMYSDVKRFL